jgi:hypothetical protein
MRAAGTVMQTRWTSARPAPATVAA